MTPSLIIYPQNDATKKSDAILVKNGVIQGVDD